MLLLTGLANHQHHAETAYQAARQEYEKSKRVVPEDAAAHRPYTGDKAYREEWRSERDLEAQRQMAKWSYFTVWATWLGVILLAVTLWEATQTAKAASDAAKAAREGVDLQLRIEQPTLRVADISVDYMFKRRDSVEFSLENIGRTPAVVTAWTASARAAPTIPDAPEYRPLTVVKGTVLRPTDRIEDLNVDVDDRDLFTGRTAPLFFWGRVDYEDVFGKIRSSGFCYRAELKHTALFWERYGGPTYNFDTDKRI